MGIVRLDHVNLRTTQLSAMVAWYVDVLGLRSGERPAFPFAGAWIYAGDVAAVHIVEIEGAPATGAETELKLEHFAFSATGKSEFEQRLTKRGETYRKNEIPSINIVQFNVWDPDGNHIHVDFPLDEDAASA